MTKLPRRRSDSGKSPSRLFHAVDRQRFGPSTCFLCGRRLGSRTRTEEHIFPKWLLHRFNLWKSRLVLLNGTSIQYKDLRIPSCSICNGEHLSAIEKKLEAATASGHEAVLELPDTVVAAWLAKVLYGLIYKQGFLKLQRHKRRGRPIITRDTLDSFSMHHLLMQSIRVPIEFPFGWPGSLFVFGLQKPDEAEYQFDFKDEVTSLAISLRLGSVGILAALQDGGAMAGFRSDFAKYMAVELHPLQFLELTAQVFYKTRLLNRSPLFTVAETPDQIVVRHMPIGGLSRAPIFAAWDPYTYARMFAALSTFPTEMLFHPPSRVLTWLNDGTGKVPAITLIDQPWPVVGLAEEIDVRR